MLVDDCDDARALARDALEADGRRVIAARNGQEALDLLLSRRDERISLIILDPEIVVRDGWRFLDLLRCYVGLANIPVLAVTRTPEADLQRMAHKAVVGCLQSPYELRALIDLVNSVLEPGEQTGADEASR